MEGARREQRPRARRIAGPGPSPHSSRAGTALLSHLEIQLLARDPNRQPREPDSWHRVATSPAFISCVFGAPAKGVTWRAKPCELNSRTAASRSPIFSSRTSSSGSGAGFVASRTRSPAFHEQYFTARVRSFSSRANNVGSRAQKLGSRACLPGSRGRRSGSRCRILLRARSGQLVRELNRLVRELKVSARELKVLVRELKVWARELTLLHREPNFCFAKHKNVLTSRR